MPKYYGEQCQYGRHLQCFWLNCECNQNLRKYFWYISSSINFYLLLQCYNNFITVLEYCKDSNPCSNGGECISTEDGNSYKCSCVPKYYGDLCQYGNCKTVLSVKYLAEHFKH